MNKILGSLFLILNTSVFALSTASVNQSWFYPGDQVILTISSDGNNVIFPVIDAVAGNPVLYTSNSQKILIINGKRSRSINQSYAFSPQSDLTIPTYTLTVDGVKQDTLPIDISLKTPVKTKMGDNYILQAKINKKSIFIGDEVELTVTIKEKKTATKGMQLNLVIPEVAGLFFIKNNNSDQASDENYNIHTLNYKIVADDFGHFDIPPVMAIVGSQNTRVFGNFSINSQASKTIKIRSNSLTLTVKPLPDELRIFGDFKIEARIDTSKSESGKAVNLIITIRGNGNFEDIEKYNLAIANTTIYGDESEFDYQQWQQKFAIVGEQDFIIPSFTLDYFDKATQRKKHIATQPINIQVKHAKLEKQPTVKIDQNLSHINSNSPANNLKYSYLLFGILIGIFIGILLFKIKNRGIIKDKNLITQIKLSRNDKALFDLLLPLNMASLSTILQQLEANIYKNAQYKIRKKDVINAIKSEH